MADRRDCVEDFVQTLFVVGGGGGGEWLRFEFDPSLKLPSVRVHEIPPSHDSDLFILMQMSCQSHDMTWRNTEHTCLLGITFVSRNIETRVCVCAVNDQIKIFFLGI